MTKARTKADIIKAVQKENGYSQKQAVAIVENLLVIIKRALESGEEVLVSGFGKFRVRSKRARKGRNPATGEDLTLPKRRVTFKCSGKLKELLNGK